MSGPNLAAGSGISALPGAVGPIYSLSLPAGTIALGGTYTLTGTGGSQVGSFTATATMPSSFGLAAPGVVNRSQPYAVSWTGKGFDVVHIILNGTVPTSANTHQVTVSCYVPASPATFSIPAAALAYLPAVTASPGIGQLVVTGSPSVGGTASAVSATCQGLTPPLVAGEQVDFGCFTAYLGVVKSITIQ